MWENIGIRKRIYVLFLLIAVLPLIAINFIWFNSSQSQLKQAAAERQAILLSNSAQRLDSAISEKVRALTTQSQVKSIIDVNLTEAQFSLLAYGILDADVARVSLVDKNGNELVHVDDGRVLPVRGNLKNNPSFEVISKISNQAFIGPVKYVGGEPQITLAVPVLAFNKLGNQDVTSQQALVRRFGSDIKGALVVDIKLGTLWSSVMEARLGSDGYAYIVDENGKLIAHPDKALLATEPTLASVAEVKTAVSTAAKIETTDTDKVYRPQPQETVSEKQVDVLSSSHPITATKWSIIGQEPIDSVFSTAQRSTGIAAGILLLSLPVAFVCILVGTRSIVLPLRRLQNAAERVGGGDLEYQIPVRSKDEIGKLAHTFNAMASRLSGIVRQIKAETSKVNVILNNVGEGVVAVDTQGNIVSANLAAATLMGDVQLNVIGQPLSNLHWTIGDKKFIPGMSDIKVYKNIVLISKNRREYFIDVLVNPISDDPSGIQAIITLLDKTAERELENMKLDFVSLAAHELRTPLTAIKGYVELISTDTTSQYSDQVKSFVERLKYSSAQSVGLINNLLNVSKIERHALSLTMEKINWNELVQGAVQDERIPAKIKAIKLVDTLPEEVIYTTADRYAISEVLNNLLSNAVKYTPDEGTIEVNVSVKNNQIYTEIKDSGIGMPESAIKHLFTKFYRVNGGLASGSGGTGLGLYISKSIAEMHGGDIKVTSQEGKGSTFTVILPIFDQGNYDILAKSGKIKESKSRGWTTKNITR